MPHPATDLTLSHEDLRFSAHAMGEGPLIVCLHGFPDNANSFRHQLPAFADAGYRAVAVTLRGYEPSSQPARPDYSLAALASDVVACVDALGAASAHVVGHDWGAAIGYTVAAAAPERVKSLTTMAVPHAGRFVNEAVRYPRQLALSWYMGFFQLRGIADAVVAREDFRFIRKLWRDWSPGWDVPADVMEDVLATFREPGVLRAALAYYRTALSPRAFTPSARAAARFPVPVPTLALTGERDGCIDTHVFEKLMHASDFPKGLEVVRIPGAGHFLHQERPEIVTPRVLRWVARWETN